MTATLQPPNFEQPGAYIDRALNERPDVLSQSLRLMLLNPEPIPTKYAKLCRDVTDYAVLECVDTPDLAENRAAHMRGLHWAYALAQASCIVKPIHLAIGPLDSEEDRALQCEQFSRGVAAYEQFSNKGCLIAAEIVPVADLLGEYPMLTRRGILTGLYMADLGIRQRRDYIEKQKQEKRRLKLEEQLKGILAVTKMYEEEAEFQAFRQLMEAGGFPDPEL